MERIQNLIREEKRRQEQSLCLIPSENHSSSQIRTAVGSILNHKYAEGYPGKRYYQGNHVIDKIEQQAIDLAKQVFGADHANVQPYSGSPANFAIMLGLLNPGDKILGFDLEAGGHLTHGSNVNFSGKLFDVETYALGEDNRIDVEEIKKKARTFQPKLIISGTTSYPRTIPFEEIQQIADEVNAYHLADISHIAGLVVSGQHPSPVPHADVVMTTTHKSLRGPRGAIILCKEELAKKIDKAVFPGAQGGPHMNTIAAKALALEACQRDTFRKYGQRVVSNAQELAKTLQNRGIQLVTGGTDNHLLVLDVGEGNGKQVAEALEERNIIVNANTIPNEPSSPFNPSGIRIGTPAITTRGLREGDMPMIANIIADVIKGEGEKEEHILTVKRITKTYKLPR